MKIAKVDHNRSALITSQPESFSVKGVVYRTPLLAENSEKNILRDDAALKNRVAELVRRGQRLYRVMNQKSGFLDGLKKDKRNKEARAVDSIIRDGNELFSPPQSPNLNLHKTFTLDGKASDAQRLIHETVAFHLRKSLRKNIKDEQGTVICHGLDVVEYLILRMYGLPGGHLDISAEMIAAFRIFLCDDYRKTKQIDQITDSIVRQSVKVQVKQDGGNLRLQLSNAEHAAGETDGLKRKSKKWLFEFMKSYAAGDGGEQKKLLRMIRQMILQFAAGITDFSEPLPLWTWGAYKEDMLLSHVWFSGQAAELMEQKQSLDASAKAERGEINRKIKESLRSELTARFRACLEGIIKDTEDADGVYGKESRRYWLEYIQRSVEKQLLGGKTVQKYKLETLYLCEHAWKEFLSYIAMKYVSMGKAVYHFAIPETWDAEKPVAFGEVLPKFGKGITSFDYERITADEDLDRELSSYALFAVNHFACSLAPASEYAKNKMSDILSVNVKNMTVSGKPNKGKLTLYPDVYGKIMRFFGGKSVWEGSELASRIKEDGEIREDALLSFVKELKELLADVRNSSFHHAAGGVWKDTRSGDGGWAELLFQKEYGELGKLYREKYYANNVPMFYKLDTIKLWMDDMYSKPAKREAQIPSFSKIVTKANIDSIIGSVLDNEGQKMFQSLPDKTIFRGTFTFLLREFYYQVFLQDPGVLPYFKNAIWKMPMDAQHKRPINDFKERIKALCPKGVKRGFGEFCQAIMTDWNQQNQGIKKVMKGEEKKEMESYPQFKLLLYAGIRDAFVGYMKQEEGYVPFNPKRSEKLRKMFSALRSPGYNPKIYDEDGGGLSQEEFCANWRVNTFQDIHDKKRRAVYAWYITAHFLSPRQLNHLAGSIRNYLQYIGDINLRAVRMGERDDRDAYAAKVDYYADTLRILEFVQMFCGRMTNEVTDYYKDEEDYAEHLLHFVDFGNTATDYVAGAAAADNLKLFCQRKIKGKEIGIYYDGRNPVINRNVARASMYGEESILAGCMKKVSFEEIEHFYGLQEELTSTFQSGICKNKKEQEKLRSFQNLKNRIELHDIAVYTEILRDFMAKMVGFAYLRERDLMYFQLGFHYIRLFYGNSGEDIRWQRVLEGDGIHITEGALLYQIVAMYRYEWPVYMLDEAGNASPAKRGSETGESIKAFYLDYCKGDDTLYNMGLPLFENLGEHDKIVKERDYIDHFHYYAKADKSILGMFSEIYRGFFSYDLRLRKSIPGIIQNVLGRYFVLAELNFEAHTVSGEDEKDDKEWKFGLKKELKSDKLTYKFPLKDGKGKDSGKQMQTVAKIDARDKIFLEQLSALLHYKNAVLH